MSSGRFVKWLFGQELLSFPARRVTARNSGALVKTLFLASVAALELFGLSALASDLPTKAPAYKTPIAAPPYNWSGFYVGANFGGGWTNGSLNIPGNNFYGGITEFIGGVQAGYNIQAGHLLFGIEGDIDWASFNHPALRFRR
jgi:opacity protein-like surface antigen